MKIIPCLLLSLSTLSAGAQSPKKVIKKLGNNPVFFIDSINVDRSELNKYQPTDIAAVTVYKDSTALELVGPDGKDGVIYITTKIFARKKYWTYFSAKSADYAMLVPTPESDTAVQYILNKRVLTTNFEGDLSLTTDGVFKSITIIDKEMLQKKYGISGKAAGIKIEANKPDGLYHARKKF